MTVLIWDLQSLFSYCISDIPEYENFNFGLLTVSLQGNNADIMRELILNLKLET